MSREEFKILNHFAVGCEYGGGGIAVAQYTIKDREELEKMSEIIIESEKELSALEYCYNHRSTEFYRDALLLAQRELQRKKNIWHHCEENFRKNRNIRISCHLCKYKETCPQVIVKTGGKL